MFKSNKYTQKIRSLDGPSLKYISFHLVLHTLTKKWLFFRQGAQNIHQNARKSAPLDKGLHDFLSRCPWLDLLLRDRKMGKNDDFV